MSSIIIIGEKGSYISIEDIYHHDMLTIDPDFTPSNEFFKMSGDETFDNIFNNMWLIRHHGGGCKDIHGSIFACLDTNIDYIKGVIENSTAIHFETHIYDVENCVEWVWYPSTSICYGWSRYSKYNDNLQEYPNYQPPCDIFLTGNLCVDSGEMDIDEVPDPYPCS